MGQGTSRSKGGRRSYLKKFSSTNIVGRSSNVDKHYFREASQRAHAMTHKDIAFMRLFGLHDPTSANDRARQQRGERQPFLVETPRDQVLKQLQALSNNVNPLHNVCLVPRTLYMFWDDFGYYFLVHYDRVKQVCVRSHKYSGRDAMLFAFHNGCVQWKGSDPV